MPTGDATFRVESAMPLDRSEADARNEAVSALFEICRQLGKSEIGEADSGRAVIMLRQMYRERGLSVAAYTFAVDRLRILDTTGKRFQRPRGVSDVEARARLVNERFHVLPFEEDENLAEPAGLVIWSKLRLFIAYATPRRKVVPEPEVVWQGFDRSWERRGWIFLRGFRAKVYEPRVEELRRDLAEILDEYERDRLSDEEFRKRLIVLRLHTHWHWAHCVRVGLLSPITKLLAPLAGLYWLVAKFL